MQSYSSFLKQEMKQELSALGVAFEKNQKTYERDLRRLLLRYIDVFVPPRGDSGHSTDFDTLRNLLLKTRIFQTAQVDPNFECAPNFEHLERLARRLLDPDSNPDDDLDTLKITGESFEQTHVSVRKLLLTNLEYHVKMYIESEATDVDKQAPHVS
jgi:hypothetical protein